MINCGEKLIDPDQEVMVDDGEHDSICEIRDFLIYNNPKMTIEKAISRTNSLKIEAEKK